MQLHHIPTKINLRHATARFSDQLRAGRVYRREDFLGMSTAVDRHLRELVAIGHLKKLAQGIYYAPSQSSLGLMPPSDADVVGAFLRDKNFLVFSPSAYNSVGLGTTQLYNQTLVYNHKRHGIFRLGNRDFDFRVKLRFPKKLTHEFLFVDLLNNLNELAEDHAQVLRHAQEKQGDFDPVRLQRALAAYGSVAVRKRVRSWGND